MRVMAADEAEGEASKRGATVLAYLPGGTAESGVKGMYDQVWQHITKNSILNQVYWEPRGDCIPEWSSVRVLPLDHQRWWRVGE